MFGKHTGFVKKIMSYHTFKMPSLRFTNIRNNVKKRRPPLRLGISKEAVLKIAGAFTIFNMPNLAWAANEVAKQTPRAGLQGLWNIKDHAVAMVSSVVGTFRGAAQATEGFAQSMAILAENIPLLVPYLKTRTDAIFGFIMVFACLVLYTFHRSGFQVSMPLVTVRKNGDAMARLMGSVPNSNKKNVFALSLIRDLPAAQKSKVLEQYYAAQKVQGLMGLEKMAGSPGFKKLFPKIVEYVSSSTRQRSSSRSASTSIINVTGSLSRTASTASSRRSSFSNTNAANVLMNFRRG
jgi:hypothetical protein